MSSGELTLDDIQDLVGRELDGRYVLEKFIDRGGYGAVYRGIDKKFNQAVAVKVGLSSREFMKEARLAAEVKHNHIVQVTDYGSDKGLAYLVMEFLQGEDLEKLFKKQGCSLTNDQLRKLVNEVGDALAYAHAEHLIHRDLKPRNIILREHISKSGTTSGNTKFVLLDFGIASKMDSEGTQRNRTQDGAGTVEYMAPELLTRDPKATPQSDIYAFGVILYQMMVGRVPFPQSDTSHMALAECLHAISHAPPPRFCDVNSDRVYPAALEQLVMECLEKDPARRPPSMSDVRHRFIEIVDYTTLPGRSSKKPNRSLTETIRPGELVDTEDEVQLEPMKPVPAQPPRHGARWFWLASLFILIGVASLIVVSQFSTPGPVPFDTLTDDKGNPIGDTSSLVLAAGKSITLTYAVNDVPKNADVKFDFDLLSAQKLVDVKIANGPIPRTSKNFVLSLPDLNARSTDQKEIKLHASVSSSTTSFDRTVKLTIERPRCWLPNRLTDLGFRESPGSRRCFIGDRMFATILDRSVAGKPVRFRLVPTTTIDDGTINRTINSFYIMEELVTNAQFREFAEAEPGFEIEPRLQAQRRWDLMAVADFPVTNIYALEAQKFAWWLGGRQNASLPSTTEWELAAGYWDFMRVTKSKFGPEIPPNVLKDLRPTQMTVPFTGAEVWLGLGPALGQFQEPRGELLKERSPYGCVYPRLQDDRRPTELTSTLIDFSSTPADLRILCQNGIPEKEDARLKREYSVLLRGAGPSGDEITWIKGQEIPSLKTVHDLKDDANEFTLLPGDFGNSDYVGFRVVLLIDIEGKSSADNSRD